MSPNLSDLVLIVISVVVSALCSGLEIAFLSSNKLYIELERKRGAIWARLISPLLKRPERVIGALLVGNNVALVLYGIAMAELLEPWLRTYGMGEALVLVSQTLLSTMVILVLAEFLPKALFRIDPNGALSVFTVPLQVLYVVMWTPMMIMTGISALILRLFGVKSANAQLVFGRIDLDEFLKEVSSDGIKRTHLDAEVEYFRNTLELSNIKVRELMVPRAEIEAIDVDSTTDELHQLFVSSGMSKLLIYKDSIDNIIGYVHGYELFRHPKSIKAVMRPVNFIQGTMPADEVLQLLIKQRNHVAVVVDEFGGTAGMLTMEDVVETIVGDIEDEHDTPQEVEERLGPDEFLFSARIEVSHLREAHRLAIAESEEYDTLAGWLMHSTGELPEQEQVIDLGPYRITVAQVEHGRIDLLRLQVLDPELGYLP
ncbi:MAG: HlyC/CorC family transporter [Flavobacteriales bacterium]|nr:HlyC/CorC family transporter [Flavobacteriales bacterium]